MGKQNIGSKKFRVWWGKQGYQSDVIEAETADDAITMATLNWKTNNLIPIKIEYLP